MTEGEPDFEAILVSLKKEQVQFVIIGGLAAIFHGHARVTYDLDICYARDRANLEKLARSLRELKSELRVLNSSIPFRPDWKTLEMGLNFTLLTSAGPFDILGEVSGVGGYDKCFEGAAAGSLYGIDVFMLSLSKLIYAKRAAGRPKDLDDLRALEMLQDMHKLDTESEPPPP